MKSILVILLVLLVVPFFAQAFVMPYVPPVSSSPVQVQRGGCMPPINFSVENKCVLTYLDYNFVNRYECGNYVIDGDCQGNVIQVFNTKKSSEHNLSLISNSLFIAALLFILFIIGFILYRIMLGREKK